jgi:hypothetical protein
VTRWGKVVPGRKLGPRGTDRGWFYGEALTQRRGDDEELRGKGVDVVELWTHAVLLDVLVRPEVLGRWRSMVKR